MPRKGKLERAQPSSPPDPSAVNKYGRWRRLVQELLSVGWQGSEDLQEVAATVVGMFDAGATDAEVADYLHSQELEQETEVSLTDEARMALIRALRQGASLD